MLEKAHMQRGWIIHQLVNFSKAYASSENTTGNHERNAEESINAVPSSPSAELQDKQNHELEAMASWEFAMAGKYSEARGAKIAVWTNTSMRKLENNLQRQSIGNG